MSSDPLNAGWVRLLPDGVRARVQNRVQLQRAVANTGWLITDRLLRMGVGLAVSVLVTRYLGPARFGILSYVFALVGLAGAVATLGLDSVVVRDIVRNPGQAGEILGTAFAMRSVSGVLALGGVLMAVSLLRPGDRTLLWLVAITGGTLVLQAFDTIDVWFQAQVQSRYAVYARNAAFLVTALLKLLLVYRRAPLVGFVWAGLLEVLLAAAGLVLGYRLAGRSFAPWRVRFATAKQLLSESWPLFLSGLAIGVYMKIDIVMLGAMAGDRAAGTYSAATRISEVWYFIPAAIVSSVAPSLTIARQRSERLYYARLNQLFHLLAATAIAIAIPMTFLAGSLTRLLYGQQYIAAGPVLALHIWAALFVFLGMGQNCWTVNEGLTKLALSRTAVGAVTNVVLNLILIPRYSGLGAAIATVISYALSAVLLNAADRRTAHIFRRQIAAIFLRDYLPQRA